MSFFFSWNFHFKRLGDNWSLISCHSSMGSLRALCLASRPSHHFNQVPLINSQLHTPKHPRTMWEWDPVYRITVLWLQVLMKLRFWSLDTHRIPWWNFGKNTIHQLMLLFNSLLLLLFVVTIIIATGQLMSKLINFFKTDFYCLAFNPWMTIKFWLCIFFLFISWFLSTFRLLSTGPPRVLGPVCVSLWLPLPDVFWTVASSPQEDFSPCLSPFLPSPRFVSPISVAALEPCSVKVNNADNIDKQPYSAGKSLRLDRNHLPETTSQIKHPPHTWWHRCLSMTVWAATPQTLLRNSPKDVTNCFDKALKSSRFNPPNSFLGKRQSRVFSSLWYDFMRMWRRYRSENTHRSVRSRGHPLRQRAVVAFNLHLSLFSFFLTLRLMSCTAGDHRKHHVS